jgi:hypothetical protein
VVNHTMDTVELRVLVDSYAMALDEQDAKGLGLLWIDGGTLLVREDGPGAAPTAELGFPTGAAPVVRRLQAYTRTVHHVTTHRSTVNGDSATGTTYCRAHHIFLGPHDQPLDKILSIRYEDHFERDGIWRFSRREVNVLLREIRPVTYLP